MPIKVLIVGGGIAGFATAIALGRQGHEVEIFEKSSFSSEIGAAFHFAPNGCRILQAWGVDLESMRPCICKRWRHLDSDDLVETSVKFVSFSNVNLGFHVPSCIGSGAEKAVPWYYGR